MPDTRHYHVTGCGYKYNMMDLQAAIGIHQLERVERSRAHREKIWKRYQEAFADLPVIRPAGAEAGTRHAYHLYTILVDGQRCGIDRDTFLDEMTRRNIGVGVHYLSIPEHPYYRKRFDWQPEAWTNAMRIGRQTASLPLSAALSNRDMEDVIHAVSAVLG